MMKINYCEDFVQLADIGEPELVQVVDLIQPHIDVIRQSFSSSSAEGMCLTASRIFNDCLRKNGFRAVILQGDIPLGENSWLEHHVSLVSLSSYFVVVDFTASQLDRYDSVVVLVLVCRQNKDLLRQALQSAYDWWFPALTSESVPHLKAA